MTRPIRSVQRKKRSVEERGEGNPRGIGHEQPCRNPIQPPCRGDKGENGGEQQKDYDERDPDLVSSEEDRRPYEIQSELSPPKPHRPPTSIGVPYAPAGD